MLDIAIDKDSSRPNEVDIELLSKILVPSDDIIDDLNNKANEVIKAEEAEAKRLRDMQDIEQEDINPIAIND